MIYNMIRMFKEKSTVYPMAFSSQTNVEIQLVICQLRLIGTRT